MATNNIKVFSDITSVNDWDNLCENGFQSNNTIKASENNAAFKNATIGSYALIQVLAGSNKITKTGTDSNFTIGISVTSSNLATQVTKMRTALDNYIYNSDILKAENIKGGSNGAMIYQSGVNTTSFVNKPSSITEDYIFVIDHASSDAIKWKKISDITNSLKILTTAPTSNNNNPPQIVLLSSSLEPTTDQKDGYLYFWY